MDSHEPSFDSSRGNGGNGRGRRRRRRRRGRGSGPRFDEPEGEGPGSDDGEGPDEQAGEGEGPGDGAPRQQPIGDASDEAPSVDDSARWEGGRGLAGPDQYEEDVDRATGVLVVVKDGFGFLRQARYSYLSGPGDVFVPQGLIQRHKLRPGQMIEGRLGRGRRGKRRRPLEIIDRVDGDPPELAARRPHFKHMSSIDPTRRIGLETRQKDATLRIVDLVTPMGFGQRTLLMAPPRTGKTVILHKIANAIGENHPDAHVMVVLVDERPEEVTDFRRTCTHAEVVASSLDMDPAAHVAVVEVVLERVKRLAEAGKDVVCMIDSLTRVARAFNIERGRSGRTVSGGMDSMAMQKPREFFSSARAFDGGGSITNLATVAVDTGSKLDQLIFEEFKGTGNSELVLSKELADLRIFPAIAVKESGTRKEEKLRDREEMHLVNGLRRTLVRYTPQRTIEELCLRVKQTQNNGDLLMSLHRQNV
jgi:transcription termination factor Rho